MYLRELNDSFFETQPIINNLHLTIPFLFLHFFSSPEVKRVKVEKIKENKNRRRPDTKEA